MLPRSKEAMIISTYLRLIKRVKNKANESYLERKKERKQIINYKIFMENLKNCTLTMERTLVPCLKQLTREKLKNSKQDLRDVIIFFGGNVFESDLYVPVPNSPSPTPEAHVTLEPMFH